MAGERSIGMACGRGKAQRRLDARRATGTLAPMKTLPDRYSANGWRYKLVQRNAVAAIYSQSMHPDLPSGTEAAAYEVFVVKRLPDVTFPNGKTTPAHEAVPNPSQWGSQAWTCHTLERARAVFGEIMAGIRPSNAKRANAAAG